MGIIDAMLGGAKFLVGYGLGFILMVGGLWTAFGGGGQTILGIVLLVIGVGLMMWGEQSRRQTLGPR